MPKISLKIHAKYQHVAKEGIIHENAQFWRQNTKIFRSICCQFFYGMRLRSRHFGVRELRYYYQVFNPLNF